MAEMEGHGAASPARAVGGPDWSGPDHRAALLAAKVRPPQQRDGIVSRRPLVDRMLARHDERIVALVAPPGYGKTTVLAEWCAERGHDVAWLSIDEADNDPASLLTAAAHALGTTARLDPGIVADVQSRTTSIPRALSALTLAIAAMPSTVVALDNVESVTNPAALDVISALALRLPAGSQFAYASRTPLPLPAPLLRSQGAVVEIGVDDLAMDRVEARQLLTSAGVSFTDGEFEDVYTRTEGWPAGLYLAALASKGRREAVTKVFAFRGDDVLMGDYLRTEVLARLPPGVVSFLVRTSVLEHLSGPLCDALLDTTDAQALLEHLESSNLLLVPLDRHRGWYRYHRLFRDLLATELTRLEPALVPELHRRAAHWLERHRLVEEAIPHAQRCGDANLVVRLVRAAVQPSFAAGRAERVLGWLDWFRTEDLIDTHRDVAVLGAAVEALAGHAASAERWTAAAEAEPTDADTVDPADEGRLAYLRCLLCRSGTARMRADAQLALELLPAQDQLRPGAQFFEGISHLLDGDPELADSVLAHAYDMASYSGAMPTAVAAAAARAFVSIARHDWTEAGTFAERSVELVESGHLQDYGTAGYAHAAAARVAAHRGDRDAADEHLARCARVRHLFTYAVPATAIGQLQIAQAYLELADPTGARTVLRELRDLLQQRPDLGAVPAAAAELAQQLDAIRQSPVGASSLTAAELRVLPYLATHLSFREIGERLHVSRHTVKTQAMAVYRKLGATSRSEAIDLAGRMGLLVH